MKKKKKVNISMIPYEKCFEEMGMICNSAGRYSISFNVVNERKVDSTVDVELIYSALAGLYIQLKHVSFQFLIRNAAIDKDEYLKQITLEENRDNKTNEVIARYNNVLAKNIDVGHNNYKTDVVLTIVTNAENAVEAQHVFEPLIAEIQKRIEEIYGFKAYLMSLVERLKLMHDIYNPELDSRFDVEELNKEPTKSLIAPSLYDKKNRNYLRVGSQHVRMFFVNNMPSENTDTILGDMLSVSNNSVLSIGYQPLDSMIGYNAATRKIRDNTEVEDIPLRRTIEDRKLKKTKRVENIIDECETDTFTRTAIEILRDSAAKEEPVIQASFIIGLFAETLEELERDTKMLKLSASKYSCQIKTCDYMQNEAFQSVLPLAETKIDVSRVFSISSISRILPININSAKHSKPMLEGLNAINDNMIFINRSKYNISLITGTSESGTTYALKRDVVNSLMSSDTTVVILTNKTQAYKKLSEEIDCKIFNSVRTDLFEKDKDYGLEMNLKKARGIFLEAYVTAKDGFYKRRLMKEELKDYYKKIETDVGLVNEMEDFKMALEYLDLNPSRCELFRRAISENEDVSTIPNLGDSRLNIIMCDNLADYVVNVDYIWNLAIEMKKNCKHVCLYLDGMDEFLHAETTSDYLISILDRCDRLKVPVTMVLNEPVKAVADEDAVIELEYLLKKVSLFKILSMGPIERKYFAEKLNIPRILVPYITDREPKEGIIISPSLNIAFNDHFESNDEPFFRIFN